MRAVDIVQVAGVIFSNHDSDGLAGIAVQPSCFGKEAVAVETINNDGVALLNGTSDKHHFLRNNDFDG